MAKKGAKKKKELETKLASTEKSLARERAKRKATEELIEKGWSPPRRGE